MGSNWMGTNRNEHSGPVYKGDRYNDKTKVTETNISEVAGARFGTSRLQIQEISGNRLVSCGDCVILVRVVKPSITWNRTDVCNYKNTGTAPITYLYY